MSRLSLFLAAAVFAAPAAAQDDAAAQQKAYEEYQKQQAKLLEEMGKKATHEQIAEVKVTGASGHALQTLCLDKDGRVLGVVAPPRGYGAAQKNVTSEIHVFTPEGKAAGKWKIPFHAHSINAAPDGTVFVAGDGRVARFDRDGKALGEPVELPHVAELLKDKDALRAKAEARLKKEKEQNEASMKQIKKQFEDKIAELEKKKEEDRSKTEKRQLEQYKAILKSYAENDNYYAKRTVENVLADMTGRLRVINGIAVGEADVFVACGETEGWGYAVWRMDHDLKNAKKVLGDIGGCCGQMDIQVQGKELLVAENTKHQFAKYDLDGKRLGGYGKRGQDTDVSGFGGCCNPMNVRGCCGDVLTAESEGVVKRFGADGKFQGVVGTVKIAGGCKNVAVGANADGSKVYFCDQPGSRFFILAKKGEKKPETTGGR
ncbi:MAG TPA: hypothetical protein VM597_11000 [Gemmataceae bacterium]|nr:hypothetical protein [Gemmataceae bacterium]